MGTHSIEPFQAIRSYRSITGMPDIGERAAARSSEGTVAFTLVDDTPVFGVNSNALAYTANDQASAEEMRDRLVGLYPETMRSDNLAGSPMTHSSTPRQMRFCALHQLVTARSLAAR